MKRFAIALIFGMFMILNAVCQAQEVDLFSEPSLAPSGDLSIQYDPFSGGDELTPQLEEEQEVDGLYQSEVNQPQRSRRQILYDRQLKEAEAAERARQQALQAQQNAARTLLQQGGVQLTNP